MIVIADTSPLNYFILLSHVEALQSLYGRVIIPQAVADELNSPKSPKPVRDWVRCLPDWLEVRQVTVPSDKELAKLDAGEREAILLAEELRADALILDERAGRREAERRKIRVIGTIRVLDDAAEAGLLDLPAALQQLQNLGFYLDRTLMEFLRERHAERERRKADRKG
jgi:predicted nucleic acid-binding protein